MDKKLLADGNELDEFEAHIFLEKNITAITVKKMREVLRDVDVDFNNEYRSPGWERFKKNKMLKWKK